MCVVGACSDTRYAVTRFLETEIASRRAMSLASTKFVAKPDVTVSSASNRVVVHNKIRR